MSQARLELSKHEFLAILQFVKLFVTKVISIQDFVQVRILRVRSDSSICN
jgi:hypothetical protein